MNRRTFLHRMLGAAAGAALAAACGLRKFLPLRRNRAIPSDNYPGRLKPLDEADLRRIGHWAG